MESAELRKIRTTHGLCEFGRCCASFAQAEGVVRISRCCANFAQAWGSRLPKAISSSFQLQIVHGLKHWILDFLIFEIVYSMKKIEDNSCSLPSHFWSTSRSPFSTCYIPFQSSGSQESNTLNSVRIGAAMRKI